MSKKCVLMCGRWAPFHKGHMAMVQHELDKGNRVCIAVRYTPTSASDPFSLRERMAMIRAVYKDDIPDRIIIMGIPDISAVVYGRGVGYDIREYVPPPDVQRVSATEVRKQIAAGNETWKDSVDPRVATWLKEYYERKQSKELG